MGTWQWVEAVQKSLSLEGRNAIASVHSVNHDYILPPSFSPAKQRGLICCQLVRNDTKGKVILLWSSQEMFNTYHQSLEGNLGFSAATFSGAQISARYKAPPVWRRVSVFTAVVAVATFFASLNIIVGWASDLFARPQFDAIAAISAEDSINVLAGGSFKLSIELRNKMETSKTDLVVTALEPITIRRLMETNSSTDLSTDFKVSHKPYVLKTGESTKMEIEFSAPVAATLFASPAQGSESIAGHRGTAQFEIEADLKGRAGVLRCGLLRRVAYRVEVWPRRGYEIRKVTPMDSGVVVEAAFLLGSPSKRDIPCGVVLEGNHDLRIESITARYASELTVESRTDSVISLRISGQDRGFRRITFLLHIRGEKGANTSWNQVINDHLRFRIALAGT